MAEPASSRVIRCPKCGKVVGEDHNDYYQMGKERNRVWKPVCPKAVDYHCINCDTRFPPSGGKV